MSMAASGSKIQNTEMSFTKVVFQFRKLNSFPSECRFLPRLPLFATRRSACSFHNSTGPQLQCTAVSKIARVSFGAFDFKKQIKNANRNSCNAQRWYSDKGSDKSDWKRDEDGDGDDDDKESSKRTEPSLGGDVIVWPNFFLTLKNLWTIYKIRYFLDRQFLMKDFVIGSKQALQVISHKLADGDFDNLKELVDTNELKRVREIVERMSVAQRSELAINKDEIYSGFTYEVVITGDEDEEQDSESSTKRVFAEILMVFHVLRGLQQLKDSKVDMSFKFGTEPEYAKDMWIVNYRFKKEFTEGVDDEWTVNLILQNKSMELFD